MERSQKVIKICEKSKFLTHQRGTHIPPLDELLDMLFRGEEGWSVNTSQDLQGFLYVLGAYALKKDITDFYELILRFTLSEVFDEEYD